MGSCNKKAPKKVKVKIKVASKKTCCTQNKTYLPNSIDCYKKISSVESKKPSNQEYEESSFDPLIELIQQEVREANLLDQTSTDESAVNSSVDHEKQQVEQSELLDLLNQISRDSTVDSSVDVGSSTDDGIKNFNNQVRNQFLSTEELKDGLKKGLVTYITRFIVCQIILLGIPMLFFTFSATFNFSFINQIEVEKYRIFFSFLKYYVSAVIVEFIGMLYLIVRYAFAESKVVNEIVSSSVKKKKKKKSAKDKA